MIVVVVVAVVIIDIKSSVAMMFVRLLCIIKHNLWAYKRCPLGSPGLNPCQPVVLQKVPVLLVKSVDGQVCKMAQNNQIIPCSTRIPSPLPTDSIL